MDKEYIMQISTSEELKKVVSSKVLKIKKKDIDEICFVLSWVKEEE